MPRLSSAVREKWRSENKCLHCGSDEHFIKDCSTCFYIRKRLGEKKKATHSVKSSKSKSKRNDESEMSEEDGDEEVSESESLKE